MSSSEKMLGKLFSLLAIVSASVAQSQYPPLFYGENGPYFWQSQMPINSNSMYPYVAYNQNNPLAGIANSLGGVAQGIGNLANTLIRTFAAMLGNFLGAFLRPPVPAFQ